MALDDVAVVSLVKWWGLPATGVEYPTVGTMNEIAIVSTPAGKVVLRGHRRRDRRRVAFEHDVMAYAGAHGIPVPAAISTPEGELVVERDGRFYSLFQHAAGYQVPRDQLDDDLATAMGAALGRLHAVLRGFRSDDAPRAPRDHDPAAVLRRIDELLAHLAARDDRGEQETWAIERLHSRAVWLRDHLDHPAEAVVDAEHVVHGDYQDTNLFFAHGRISAIIDWDKAEIRAPGEEVVRAMHLSLGLEPTKCRAFLGGYRNISALSDDELHRSAIAYGHARACDLWLYETVYLHGDDRPRRFLTPGQFTPFTDQWKSLSAALR